MADVVEQVIVKFIADNASYLRDIKTAQDALIKYQVYSTNILEKIEKNTSRLAMGYNKVTQATIEMGRAQEKTAQTQMKTQAYMATLNNQTLNGTQKLVAIQSLMGTQINKVNNIQRKFTTEASSGILTAYKHYMNFGSQLGYLARQYISLFAIMKLFQTTINTGMGFNKFVETTTMSFSVMMKSMDAAKAKMEELYDFAVKSPLTFRETAEASRQLMAYGFQASELVDTMKLLGTVGKAVGSSMSDMAYTYGTLKSQGRAYNRDLMQFAMRGIPIYEELAKVVQRDVKEIQKLTESGAISFKQVELAFRNMTNEGGRFGGMLDRYMTTFEGKLSMLGDLYEQAMGNLTRTLFNDLKIVIDKLIRTMETADFQKVIKGLAQDLAIIASMLVNIVETLASSYDILKPIVGLLLSLKAATSIVRTFAALKLPATLTSIGVAAKAAGSGVATFGTIVGATLKTINPWILGLTTIIMLLPKLTKAMDDYKRSTKEQVQTDSKFRTEYLGGVISGTLNPMQKVRIEDVGYRPMKDYIALIDDLAAKYEIAREIVADIMVSQKIVTKQLGEQIKLEVKRTAPVAPSAPGGQVLTDPALLAAEEQLLKDFNKYKNDYAKFLAEIEQSNVRMLEYEWNAKIQQAKEELANDADKFAKAKQMIDEEYNYRISQEAVAMKEYMNMIDEMDKIDWLDLDSAEKTLKDMGAMITGAMTQIDMALQIPGLTEDSKTYLNSMLVGWSKLEDQLTGLWDVLKQKREQELKLAKQSIQYEIDLIGLTEKEALNKKYVYDLEMAGVEWIKTGNKEIYDLKVKQINKQYEYDLQLMEHKKLLEDIVANQEFNKQMVSYQQQYTNLLNESNDLLLLEQEYVNEVAEIRTDDFEQYLELVDILYEIYQIKKNKIIKTHEQELAITQASNKFEYDKLLLGEDQLSIYDLELKYQLEQLQNTINLGGKEAEIAKINYEWAVKIGKVKRENLEKEIAYTNDIAKTNIQNEIDLIGLTEKQARDKKYLQDVTMAALEYAKTGNFEIYQLTIDRLAKEYDYAVRIENEKIDMALEASRLVTERMTEEESLNFVIAKEKMDADQEIYEKEMKYKINSLKLEEDRLALIDMEKEQALDSIVQQFRNGEILSKQAYERQQMTLDYYDALKKKTIEQMNLEKARLYLQGESQATRAFWNRATVNLATMLGMKGYASGTQGASRGWSVVGEEGPELMFMKGGETVIPNDKVTGYAKGTLKEDAIEFGFPPDMGAQIAKAIGQMYDPWLIAKNIAKTRMLETGASIMAMGGEEATGSEVGKMVAGAAVGGTGDPLTMFLMSLGEFVMSIENVQKVLNPFATTFEAMGKIIEPIINSGLQPIVDLLIEAGTILGQMLAPFLNFASIVIKIAATGIRIARSLLGIDLLGKAFQWFNDYVIVPIGNVIIDIMNAIIKALNKLPFVEIAYLEHLQTIEEITNQAKKLATGEQALNDTLNYLTNKLQEQVNKQISTYQDLYEAGLITASAYEAQVKAANALLPDQNKLVSDADKALTDIAAIAARIEELTKLQNTFDSTDISDAVKVGLLEGFKLMTDSGVSILTNEEIAGIIARGSADTSTTTSTTTKTKPSIKPQGFAKYATGTPYVPSDMIASIHQGEMIVPKTFSDSIRNGEMVLGNTKSTGSVNYNVVVNVEGSVTSERDLTISIAKAIQKQTVRGYV